MDIHVNDVLKMKKAHPCGSQEWLVLRVGMDFKLRCQFRFLQGSFAAPAASDFLDGQKVTKEPPRGGLRIGTACPYSPAPWTPILRGPQSGSLGGHRKGAGGQRIGFRSMTAAAEFPVTFGWYSYWLEARLLGWWGSSSAQRDGVSQDASGSP